MDAKVFIFWASVGAVALADFFLFICWCLKNEKKITGELGNAMETPKKEVGFHAIAKDHEVAIA